MASIDGILIVNKPARITSREAVDAACKRLRTKEIGHCGTLDPLATGVLVLVVGRARRLQDLLSRSRKVYLATLRLGGRSETDDAEGPITWVDPEPMAPSEETVRRIAAQFVGEIEQRPPSYSAIKLQGKRLYELARAGTKVDAPARKARVFELEVLEYDFPRVRTRIACAGGTYVRSIARDLGENLGIGGFLESLCRIESSGFDLSRALAPEVVDGSHLLPIEEALPLYPRIDIAAAQVRRLANGAAVHCELPPLRLDQDEQLFGWVNGRAVAWLKRSGVRQVRSNRLLVTPEELQALAEEELSTQDAMAARARPQ